VSHFDRLREARAIHKARIHGWTEVLSEFATDYRKSAGRGARGDLIGVVTYI